MLPFILNTTNYHDTLTLLRQSTAPKKPTTLSSNLGQAYHKRQIPNYRQYLKRDLPSMKGSQKLHFTNSVSIVLLR